MFFLFFFSYSCFSILNFLRLSFVRNFLIRLKTLATDVNYS